MSLYEAMRTAYTSLLANKSRSVLTMLGVIIGVAAVVMVVSIGEGMRTDITGRITSMGSNLITIQPGGGHRGPGSSGQTQPGELDEHDLKEIEQNVADVVAIAPVVSTNATAKYRNLTHTTSIIGSNTDWSTAQAFEIEEGEFFSAGQQRSRARVCVVGSDVVDELFLGRSPVGEYVRVDNMPFEVIGVLEEKGGGFGSADNQIIMPIATARQRLVGNANLHEIILSAANEDVVPSVIEQIEETLYRTHRVDASNKDFEIRDQSELLETVSETTQQITLFIGGIAAVSLIVGGVGIMNIMLVSVAERTREIGVRKAVGARRFDILAQFLIEAVLLSVLGGLIGIILGYAGAGLIGSKLGWSTVVPMWSVAVSFAFAGGVGVFFGYYPARTAAMLDPIECLRSE